MASDGEFVEPEIVPVAAEKERPSGNDRERVYDNEGEPDTTTVGARLMGTPTVRDTMEGNAKDATFEADNASTRITR